MLKYLLLIFVNVILFRSEVFVDIIKFYINMMSYGVG